MPTGLGAGVEASPELPAGCPQLAHGVLLALQPLGQRPHRLALQDCGERTGTRWGRVAWPSHSTPPGPPPCPAPRTTQVDGQRGQDQARQCQEPQQGQEQGVAGAEAGAGAGGGHRSQGGQERRGAGGHGARRGPAQAAGGSRAVACGQGREEVRAQPPARPGLARPLLAPLSPSAPFCPPEAQCRSLMDSTGRRLMAPVSLPSGSPGSAGAAPSALPMLSAGSGGRG